MRIADYKIEDSDFTSMAMQFSVRYLSFFAQLPQKSGSFSNNLQKVNNRYLQRIAQVFGVAVNAIAAIPASADVNSGLGNSQWVHLVKN